MVLLSLPSGVAHETEKTGRVGIGAEVHDPHRVKSEHVNPAAGRGDVQVTVAEKQAGTIGATAQELGEGADGPCGGEVGVQVGDEVGGGLHNAPIIATAVTAPAR